MYTITRLYQIKHIKD